MHHLRSSKHQLLECDKLPYCGVRHHYNARFDPSLPVCTEEGEESCDFYLRRWGCYCPACRQQLASPKLEDRYKTPVDCVLARQRVLGLLSQSRQASAW